MSCIYRHERTGIWYLQYRCNGRNIKFSLHTRDREAAKAEQDRHDARETLNLITPPPPATPDVAQALGEWLESKRSSLAPRTFRRYWFGVQELLRHFKGEIGRLSRKDVTEFVHARHAQGRSNKTILDDLNCLSQCIRWLIEDERLERDPIVRWPKLKRIPVHPDRLAGYSASEAASLIADAYAGTRNQCPQEWGDWLTVLAYTGCRDGEVKLMRAADVLLERNMIAIRCKKTNTRPENTYRHVEIHPKLLPVLQRRIQGKGPGDFLFAQHHPDSLRLWLHQACKRLGIQYRRLHGFRHSFVTRLAEASVAVGVISKLVGHSTIATTLRYTHIQDGTVGVVGKLE